MSNNMSTFKRHEKKYMISMDQYESLILALKAYTLPDAYDEYTICNLYYDTETFEIIRRSIEKPVYKEKLRIRSYGTPSKESPVFFELKKKFNKEVFKRRVSMQRKALDAYLSNGLKPDVSSQVLSEIEYFMSMYKPVPRIFIAYERSALTGKYDENLRITFDRNIRYRCEDLDLSMGDYGMQILDDSLLLMEIKIQGAFPLWLSSLLNEMNIFPTSFSKYGYCYTNYISQNTSPPAGYGKEVHYA